MMIMNRKAIFALMLGLCVGAAWLLIDLIWSHQKKTHTGNYLGDDYYIHNQIAHTLKDVYQTEGKFFVSLSEFESTAFYPFRQSLSPTPNGGRIVISVDVNKSPHEVIVRIASLPSLRGGVLGKSFDPDLNANPSMPTTVKWPLAYSNKQITELRLKNVLAGPKEIANRIVENRDGFIRNFTGTSALTNFRTLTIKPLKQTQLSNLPDNEKQLTEYLAWVRYIYGVNGLSDGWGRDLKFELRGGKLIGRSRGADSKWVTKDDIFMLSR